MTAMLPIDPRRRTRTPAPRVHPSWGTPDRAAPPPARLDSADLRRLWDAVDGD